MDGPIGSQAVNGAVGPVRVPMAVQQHPVGGVVADDKRKRADDDAAVCQNIAVAPGNVRQQLRQAGIVAAPLTGVAVGSHVRLGNAEDIQNGGYIRR